MCKYVKGMCIDWAIPCYLLVKKNSEAQNYDFNKKKDVYFRKRNVAPFALTTQVISEPEWTPTVIERRQRLLMDKLISIWRLN
jgi:hypothetical protein